MPAATQLLFSDRSKQVPTQTPSAPLTSELPLAAVGHLISGPPLADVSLQLGAFSFAAAGPLTSEPPLADATPLTSEPPLAAVAPLTSEPTAPGTAGGMEFPGV
ncbi:hypothetical protein [Streptomyces pratensis]|uniref:hypothetical protein n=1 Tax=Streptomyces pratensis TaxID=1169025 RepID=UPI003019048D